MVLTLGCDQALMESDRRVKWYNSKSGGRLGVLLIATTTQLAKKNSRSEVYWLLGS